MFKLGKELISLLKNGINKLMALLPELGVMLKKITRIEQLSRLSIRYRLLFSILMISIIPITLMGYFASSISNSAISAKIAKYSRQGLIQTNANLTLLLQKYEEFTKQFISYREQNQWVSLYVNTPATNGLTLWDNFHKIDNYITGSTVIMADLAKVVVYPLNDKKPVSVSLKSNEGSNLDPQIFEETFERDKKKELFAKIRDKQMAWDTFDNFILYGRLIKDLVTGQELAIIVLFISKDRIDQLVNIQLYNDPDYMEDWLKNRPYSILIDGQGVILSSPLKKDKGLNIEKLLNDFNALDRIRSFAENQAEDRFSGRYHNQNVLITFNPLPDKGWYLLSIAPDSYLYKETNTVGWLAIILIFSIMIVAAYVSVRFTNSIAGPLTQVMSAMRQAESGDLSTKVNIKYHNELGQLGASFNRMISQIHELILQTKNTINEVMAHSNTLGEISKSAAEAARLISSVAEEISRGTTVQTTEAENTAAKMGELAEKISGAVMKSKEVEQMAESARELSVTAKDIIQKLVLRAQEADQITNIITTDIKEMNSSAEEIRMITELISNIAEQTNLLALNASIEAARAKEFGKGFAVVANEVTKVAAQSQETANTINDILMRIQAKSINSTENAAKAHKAVEEQLKAVQQAQRSFDAIIDAMDTATVRINEMNKMIQHIDDVKQDTMNAIINISSICEQTAASSQEVTASIEEQAAFAEHIKNLTKGMVDMSAKLEQTILQFKLMEKEEKAEEEKSEG
ncbi:MAG: methyl-accepting chemotaxis protein [Firmicutes bacterium]|nr:methyl-accepting chemotaxis protein [Bacillota bacterium]